VVLANVIGFVFFFQRAGHRAVGGGPAPVGYDHVLRPGTLLLGRECTTGAGGKRGVRFSSRTGQASHSPGAGGRAALCSPTAFPRRAADLDSSGKRWVKDARPRGLCVPC